MPNKFPPISSIFVHGGQGNVEPKEKNENRNYLDEIMDKINDMRR
jgi:hypothetical protein